jgi:DNA-binding response OmpR family regulator
MEDTINGLDVGADDYMVKPFRLPELVARMRALIRRSHAVTDAALRHGPLSLNTATREATLAGRPLELTNREWAILEALLMASPNVLNKSRLVQTLAGWDKDITPNAVEVHVSRLRAKLAASGMEIRTVRGIGYRIDPET